MNYNQFPYEIEEDILGECKYKIMMCPLSLSYMPVVVCKTSDSWITKRYTLLMIARWMIISPYKKFYMNKYSMKQITSQTEIHIDVNYIIN